MSDYEKMCIDFVSYMGGDINSDEYKLYLMRPFPNHVFKEKNKQIQQLEQRLKEEIQLIKSRLIEAEKVIEFYSDKENWYYDQIWHEDTVLEKGGKRARQYLEKYKGETNNGS